MISSHKGTVTREMFPFDDVMIECRYNAVQGNKILHTSLQALRQNINQTSPTKDIPYLALTGELWISFVNIFDKTDRAITAPHCSWVRTQIMRVTHSGWRSPCSVASHLGFLLSGWCFLRLLLKILYIRRKFPMRNFCRGSFIWLQSCSIYFGVSLLML